MTAQSVADSGERAVYAARSAARLAGVGKVGVSTMNFLVDFTRKKCCFFPSGSYGKKGLMKWYVHRLHVSIKHLFSMSPVSL